MRETPDSTAAPAAKRRKFRRGSFILNPPSYFTSLDHPAGAGEHCCRKFEAERPSGLEIDNQLVLGRRLHRKISRLRALEDTVDIASGESEMRNGIRAVGDQAAAVSEIRVGVHSRQSVAGGELMMRSR